ncbi:MAG: TonB-dependent receptor [Dysgonamonadaceae bacterium]|jgi:TonB-linked SusC/RagA family outer membrane protein|nr:TonB-dependent receptor [Dysgonamonadaceae bacterium]
MEAAKQAKSFLLSAIVLVYVCSFAYAQGNVNVSGTVTDTNGEGLPGVNVSEKGTDNGTSTGLDGKYRLTVRSGESTLLFSFIGFIAQEQTVGDKTVINVTLSEDTRLLDEVVVVGYGTQNKKTLTGSVAVVSDKILRDKGTISSPLQAMQGQVPGVIITRNSTAPGDESWDMKLRGAVSANNATPLIVIDGVAYESVNALRNMNPADIESVNFLKDASAAIYGSRAAGGVVLITTKRAQEGKTVVEYNGSYTQKKVGLQPHLMSMNQWADAVIQARTNDGYTDSDSWIQYAKLSQQYAGRYIDFQHSSNPFTNAFTDVMDMPFVDTNWTDVLFGDAGSTQHNLAVSSGSTKNAYRLSLGYMYDGSNLQWGENNNNRYNIRLTNKMQVSDRFDIQSMIAYNRQDQVVPAKISNALTSSYPQPGLPASTVDGKPYSWGTWLSPVWFAQLGGDNRLKVSEINISEEFTFNLLKGLDLVSNVGYNTSTATRDIKNLAIKSFNYAGTRENQNVAVSQQANTSYEKTSSRRDFYSLSAYLNYKKSFDNVHNINLMAGTQYELTQYDYFGAIVKDIQPSLDALNGAGDITLKDNKGTKWHEAIMSYYSRLNYNYKSKYLLEGMLRYDGSSRFLTNRWDLFWGVSGGWIITEEAFMKNQTFLDYLKLRASYGVVGNQSGIDRYEGQQLYNFTSSSGALMGDGKATIINTNGKIASFGREWERIYNYNLGLDFNILQNRLSATVDVFRKRNNNMLITITYPGILGDNAGYSNSGKFESKGYEGQLNWRDKIGNVHYNIGGTFTWYDNKLTDVGGTSVLAAGFKEQQQDYPLNSVFGYKYVGKIQTPEQQQEYLANYLTGNTIGLTDAIRLGDNMFEDSNGDGILDYNDLHWLGSDDPKISYSINLGVEWNNFDLSVVFQGAGKRTIFRTQDNNWTVPMRGVYLTPTDQSVGNVWSPETPDARYPTYTNNSNLNIYNYLASSWTVENGAYLRLKNVTLGYNVPKSILDKTKFIQSCRIYATGVDLWEKTAIHDGWDPEASRGVSGVGRYPFVRTVTFGLSLTF